MRSFGSKANLVWQYIAMLCVFAFSGCGDGLIPIQTAPVKGVVRLKGKPLENYRIFLYCEDAAAQEPSTGLIQRDGSFEITTREKGDGAIVGMNKVYFSWDPPIPPSNSDAWNPPPPTITLPEKYLSRETSGLSLEVSSAGREDYRIDLE